MEVTVKRIGNSWHYSDGTVLPVVSGGEGPSTAEAFVGGVIESGNAAAAVEVGALNVPDGIIVGAQPSAASSSTNAPPAAPAAAPAPPAGKVFTEAELELARKQERDKLYADIEKTKERNKELEKAERDRQKTEDDARKAAEEEQRKKDADEMELRELMNKRDQEWAARFEEQKQAQERLEATLEMERRYVALTEYRGRRINEERENILPQLQDMVFGNTEEEVEQSIVSLRERTAAILADVQTAVGSSRQTMLGSSVTAPPVGPLETTGTYQSITPEEIRNMDINTYAQNRDRLLGATKAHARDQGIYGPR